MHIPFSRRVLSYLYPVKIRTAAGITTPYLHLYLFQGRWQLASATALYSDGHHYRPLRAAFRYLLPRLQQAKNMLVLGAGLGSAVTILDRLDCSIQATLADIDPTVLAWAQELQPEALKQRHSWLLADVRELVVTHDQQYEVLVIDIFQDRIVPAFVTSEDFLSACSRLLAGPDSIVVLNYIINNEQAWQETQDTLQRIFRIEKILNLGINQVVIAKMKK